ncbi:hypothetical protein [Sphingopyxis microcysteis]|uniref:hypothetical protein n=1 Tax=Sphingopyxis microcysteis TaxID=2484145 RepID=UPI0014460040|nr:hypothetical protein [Sphingopyxis microcysteis]
MAKRYDKVRIDSQFRVRVMAVVLLSFSGAVGPAARAQEAPSPRVGHEAARELVGNTLVYAKPEQPKVETGVYLRLDGTGLAATRGGGEAPAPRAVRWANLSDGRFCITDADRQPWDGDCGKLSVDGARATLTPKSGPAWPGRVLAGDAWQLDPATAFTRRSDGKAAIAALVGHTMIFVPEGGKREYRAHYLMPDGTARRAHNDEPDFDHWVLQGDERWSIGDGDRLCFSGGVWKEEFCAAVSIAGDLVTLRHPRVGSLHARLVEGDARKLSPAIDAANRKRAAALVGRTLLLTATDRQAATDSRLYFQRDGAGLAKQGDRPPEPIQWLLQRDGRLCVAARKRAWRDGDCVAWSLDGDRVTLTAPDRPAIPGRLLPGKALDR